jgi:hypothetical protein
VSAYAFIRLANEGDGKQKMTERLSLWRLILPVEGRTKARHVWLAPREVISQGLVDDMRIGLEAEDEPESGATVTADQWWAQHEEQVHQTAAARNAREVPSGPPEATASAPNTEPAITRTVLEGRTPDGYRWYNVEDVDEPLIAWDNKPAVEAAMQAVDEGREGARPVRFNHGVIPLAVVQAVAGGMA